MSGLTRKGKRPNLSFEIKFSGANGGRGKKCFLVQLTTSMVTNYMRPMRTLLKVITILT